MALFDSMITAFKGGKQNRAPLSQGIWNNWLPTLSVGAASRNFEYKSAVKAGFVANPIAQRAVRLVAEGIGQAPLASSDPQLTELVSATSAGQSLIETLAAHLLLHGNSYVQILKDASGKPIEMFALRPDRVKVIADDTGWPCAYEYRVGENVTVIPAENEDGWPNAVQIKAMHPLEDHYGAGALAAAHSAITIHNLASEWNRTLLENAARPSGALVYDSGDGGGLSTDQFNRLKAELENAFSGAANAGRPLLLDGGLSWQNLALSPADMDFATLKSTAAREIALAFGVPPMLLGLPGDNTYSNYREANRALWRLTLLPLADKIFSALSESLRPWFLDAELKVDLDGITALSEDRERLWKQVSAADFLSRSEKRSILGFAADSPSDPTS